MSDKLYHSQPCFCLPCKALRAGETKTLTPGKGYGISTIREEPPRISIKKRGRPKK